MINNNKKGVSLIALVITIIVIIILASISYVSSTWTINNANFAKYATNINNVSETIRKKALVFEEDMLTSGKIITDGQKYNYIAKGGKTEDDIKERSEVPSYSVIDSTEIDLPEMTVNTPTKNNVNIKYGVTADGKIFTWPPFMKKDEYYITDTDTVDEETAQKTGSVEISVDGQTIIINVDENGELIDGSVLPVQNGKVVLTKSKVKGSYTYNGKEQTLELTNYNSNIMTITNNVQKDAGTYTVTIGLKDTQGYVWQDGTTQDIELIWTIEKKQVPVKWESAVNFIYDGTEKAPTATVDNVEGEIINLKIDGAATNIGNYTATASIISVTGGKTENYILTNIAKPFTITKGTIKVTATGYVGGYDEQEHGISVVVDEPATGTTIYYSENTILTEKNYQEIGSTTSPKKKEIGEYTIYYYVVSTGRVSASGSQTIVITKGTINPVLSMADYIYGETKSTPIIEGVKESANVTYYYNTTGANTTGAKWETVTSATSLNVGTYYIYAEVDETLHYWGAKTSAIEFKVNKKALVVTADAKSKIYGESDPEFTYKYTGNVEGQIPAFTGKLSRNTGENVGTYLITQGTLGLTNNDKFLAENYEISFNSANLTITPKTLADLTMTLSVTSYTYNGEERKPTATITYNGNNLTAGTDYTITYKNNINKGTATVTIEGKGNFTGKIEKTFTISAKQIAVSWGSTITFTYDGSAHAPTASATSGVTGETINLTITGSATNYGSYTATATISSVSGGQGLASNYTLTSTTKSYSITKKAVSVVWGSETEFPYDGSVHVPTASASSGVTGETLNITVTGSATNPGSYTATATLSSVSGGQGLVSNYTLSNTTKAFTILKGIEVGDYINYTPTSASASANTSNTGGSAASFSTNTSVKWRILSINNGKIVATTVSAANTGLNIYGKKGYVNGVTELNRLCKALYSNSSKSITARSLTVEDVNTACGYTPSTNVTRVAFYPKSGGSTSNVTLNGKTYTAKRGCDGKYYSWDNSSTGSLTHATSTGGAKSPSSGSPILVTDDRYIYYIKDYNTTVASILGNNSCWLASRRVWLRIDRSGSYTNYVSYGLRMLGLWDSNTSTTLPGIGDWYLITSAYESNEDGTTAGLRPAIEINTSKIDLTDKTNRGATASTGWTIK